MPTVSLRAPSARYLSFAEREEIALLRAEGKGVARSRASRDARRRRSRASCAAMPRRAVARMEYRASVAQWQAEQRAKRPKAANSQQRGLRSTWPGALVGQVRRPDAVPGRASGHGTGGNKPSSAGPAVGEALEPGADLGPAALDFPDDRRCGSAMRRSTSRCSCRAGCAGRELTRACARPGAAGPRARSASAARAYHRRGDDQRAARRSRRRCCPGTGRAT